MAWKQLRQPNYGIWYTGGWCLDAIRRVYGIPAKYGRAIDDWTSGVKYAGMPPSGISVPVYFSLGNVPAGHVAAMLPDGRVASSSKGGTHEGLYIHPNIQDLINMYSNPAYGNGKCTYLGWSDEVNDIKVVENIITGGSDMLDEMTIKRAVEGAYLVSTGKLPGANIIQQKADYIMKHGGFNQVLADIFSLDVYYSKKNANGNVQPDPATVEKALKYDQIKKALS